MATFVESVIHCGPARNTEPRPRVRVLVEDEGLKLLISQSHHRIVFGGATKLEFLARIVNEGHTLGKCLNLKVIEGVKERVMQWVSRREKYPIANDVALLATNP